MQAPCFIFETLDKERVVLYCESHFETLPYKKSLEFLIDLALHTRDKEWFDELAYKLNFESQP
ncbi:IDEAL domain-containing protein [Ammoniphilus sp. CFH 90114]|uniref:IDEAL domain-containing protein n=1 Tax=Ammoniphilus sp. CFH 90114 TaxID=2493665 RepID=UPI0034CF1A6A